MARTWSLFIFTLVVLIAAAGCGADDEVKRGADGEFCGGADDSCRAGLTCVEGICQNRTSGLEYDCDDVCDTLEDCGTLRQGCLQECGKAVEDWSLRAIESFGECFTTEVTCTIAADEPEQFCYDRIAIPDGRSDRCSLFAATVRGCDSEADTEELRRSCFRTGRVGTDTKWAETERCAAAVEEGVCSVLGTCLNDVFDTEYSLPDNSN